MDFMWEITSDNDKMSSTSVVKSSSWINETVEIILKKKYWNFFNLIYLVKIINYKLNFILNHLKIIS